jgi:hypothetical protein
MSTPIILSWSLGGVSATLTMPDLGDDSDLGIDIAAITDIWPDFRLARGRTNLAMALLRRLRTPRGALAEFGDDPDYGYDIIDQLNSEHTEAELAGIDAEVDGEVLKDPRVRSAEVETIFTRENNELSVTIDVLSGEGPFRLVLAVSDLTVERLNEPLAR